MIRICQENVCLHVKGLIKYTVFKDTCLKPTIIGIHQSYFTRHFASREKQENKLERIYYGPLTPQIRAVKIFSVTSSAAGLAAQPFILREASTIGSTPLLVAICSVVGFFTFVTPLLLHFITKKYVTEIHYDPETSAYKATTINFFIAPKQVSSFRICLFVLYSNKNVYVVLPLVYQVLSILTLKYCMMISHKQFIICFS